MCQRTIHVITRLTLFTTKEKVLGTSVAMVLPVIKASQALVLDAVIARAHVLLARKPVVCATAPAFAMLVVIETHLVGTRVALETVGRATACACAELASRATLVRARAAYLAVAVEPRIARDTVMVVLRIACSSGGLLAVIARARILHALKVVRRTTTRAFNMLKVAAFRFATLRAHFATEPMAGITLSTTVCAVGYTLLAFLLRPIVTRAHVLLAAVVVTLQRTA